MPPRRVAETRPAALACVELTDAYLAALAEAANMVAADVVADVASVPTARRVVPGALLTASVLLTMRRMAQRVLAVEGRTDRELVSLGRPEGRFPPLYPPRSGL